jgi:putative FmdB family regulatory protein
VKQKIKSNKIPVIGLRVSGLGTAGAKALRSNLGLTKYLSLYILISLYVYKEMFMPLYTYTCNDCGERFEFLKIRSDEIPECPKCKSKDLKRNIDLFSSGSGSKSSDSCPTGTCPFS